MTLFSSHSPLGSRRLAIAAMDWPTPPTPTTRAFMVFLLLDVTGSRLRRVRGPSQASSEGYCNLWSGFPVSSWQSRRFHEEPDGGSRQPTAVSTASPCITL